MTAAMGAQAKFAVGAAATAIGSFTSRFEALSFTVAKTGIHINPDGIRGTRSMSKETVRNGGYTVGGGVSLTCSPETLDLFLPHCLGTAEATDVFALAETLIPFALLADYGGTTRIRYDDLYVNKATFKGSAGANLTMDLDIVGITADDPSATAFPSISISVADTNAPYIFEEAVLTLQSATRVMTSFELVVDNQLQSRRANSLTTSSIDPQGRIVTLKTVNPFTSDEDELYNQAVAGAAGTIVFTNGTYSVTFSLANLKAPAKTPTIPGKAEITQSLEMTAYKSATTNELIVTNEVAL